VFGPPADPYAHHPKAPEKPKKAKKKKPTEEPREDVAGQASGDGAVDARVSCSDVLSDPSGYDRALVQLCRRASR
jgi:hypothetical protein